MNGKERDGAKFIDEGRAGAVVVNTYADGLESQSVACTELPAIEREFLTDVGLLASLFSGDVSKLRGYLCGRLELYCGMSLGQTRCW